VVTNGADVNPKDSKGYTPLHWAASKDVEELLRQHGGVEGTHIQASTGTYGIGNKPTPPVVLARPFPRYTEEARKARRQGVVVLKAVINTDGMVDGVKILKGLGYGLDEEAISTVICKWRFKPATLNGNPVDFNATIEVEFTIH
jgi:TonB family protein